MFHFPAYTGVTVSLQFVSTSHASLTSWLRFVFNPVKLQPVGRQATVLFYVYPCTLCAPSTLYNVRNWNSVDWGQTELSNVPFRATHDDTDQVTVISTCQSTGHETARWWHITKLREKGAWFLVCRRKIEPTAFVISWLRIETKGRLVPDASRAVISEFCTLILEFIDRVCGSVKLCGPATRHAENIV